MSSNSSDKENPLEGVSVLDFTAVMAGPFCTRLLADVGADVIKVEPPEGELMRGRQPMREGRSAYFGQLNCGKRSLVLDLKKPDGLQIARRLAAKSDVVIENFRPGVMKRLGLDHETLAKDNPRLIFCAISGYGQTGPAAGRPAYAPVVHAASGYDLANMSYQEGAERPPQTGIFMADVLGGIYAFGAIQTALLQRVRTGRGQFIDVALIDSMLSMLVHEGLTAQFLTNAARHLYAPLNAADGYVILAPVSQRNFEALAHAIGKPQWLSDPRFNTLDQRAANWASMMRIVEQWTSQRSAEECESILSHAGVPCSKYRTVGEAYADEQVVHRGSLTSIDDGSGPFLVPNPPFQFSEARAAARPFVAELGAHTDQVLREVLHHSNAEIAALRRNGAVA
jgi:CoA:oxalate CoA-transferase